jgi:hypothetical protein
MRDEDKWKCPWCGKVAMTVRESICDSRSCVCGAVAVGAPDCDWDEVTDEALGLFAVPVRAESVGCDESLRDDIRRDGVEMREGVTDPDMGHPRPYQYMWFRRASGG